MAVLTRDAIKALIAGYIVENGNFGITPNMVSEILVDIADSYAMQSDTAVAVDVGSVNINVPKDGLKVSGVKVVGAQAGAIDDMPDTGTPERVGINAILTAMRSHGLIATAI